MEKGKKINLSKLISAVFAGLFISIGFLFIIGIIASMAGAVSRLKLLFWLVWILSGILLYKCSSNKRLWGWALTSMGIESFLIPVASFIGSIIFSVSVTGGEPTDSGVAMLLGGGIASAFLGVIAFFFGLPLLIVGILLLIHSKKEEK